MSRNERVIISVIGALLFLLILVTIAVGYYWGSWTFDNNSQDWEYGYAVNVQSGTWTDSFGHGGNGALYVDLDPVTTYGQGVWYRDGLSAEVGSETDYLTGWLYLSNIDRVVVSICYNVELTDCQDTIYDDQGDGWAIYTAYPLEGDIAKTVYFLGFVCSNDGDNSGYCYIDDISAQFSGGATPTPTQTRTVTATPSSTPIPTSTHNYVAGCNITSVTDLDIIWLSWCRDECLWTPTPTPSPTRNWTQTPTPDCSGGMCRYQADGIDSSGNPGKLLVICPMVYDTGDRPIPPEPTCIVGDWGTDEPLPPTHVIPTKQYTPPATITPRPRDTKIAGIDCSIPTYRPPTPIVGIGGGYTITDTLYYTQTYGCITVIPVISLTVDLIVFDPISVDVDGAMLCIDFAYLVTIDIFGITWPMDELIAFLFVLAAISILR